MALEPAGLKRDGAARRRPVRPVRRRVHSTTCGSRRINEGYSDLRDAGVHYLHGYIHCMPYGKVSLVIRLSPRHPGYVMTVCAAVSVERAVASINVESIVAGGMGYGLSQRELSGVTARVERPLHAKERSCRLSWWPSLSNGQFPSQ